MVRLVNLAGLTRRGRAAAAARPRTAAALAAAFVLVVVLGAWAARVTSDALGARSSLAAAQAHLAGQRPDDALVDLGAAVASFDRTARALERGPVAAMLRVLPIVRVQRVAASELADIGADLSRALAVATGATADLSRAPADDRLPRLRETASAVHDLRRVVDDAVGRVEGLGALRVLWPVSAARDQLRAGLDEHADGVRAADDGMRAVLTFMGGDGPRRYLVLAQNPDEPRPTGGFIGTYGVLETADGAIRLSSYQAIEQFLHAHPDAVVSEGRIPSPLRLANPPARQNLANVNAVADWPTAAVLATAVWEKAGREPVDGVIGITPGFLVRVLEVTGQVFVDGFDEKVDAKNAWQRIDHWTHEIEGPKPKAFIAALAHATLSAAAATSPADLPRLGGAVAAAFEARQATAWSRDTEVMATLEGRGWDGRLPETDGDFFANAEFAYAAKNGRTLRRAFDHRVEVRGDGSARITTVVTIENPTEHHALLNRGSLSHITLYGPSGATLAEGPDEPVDTTELRGHPGASWYREAPPMGSAKLTVVWDAPAIVAKRADGSFGYGLWWMALPDHTGDVIRLRVDLPDGWRWKDEAPPGRVWLDGDFVGTWDVVRPSG